jgi:hypothetical protein
MIPAAASFAPTSRAVASKGQFFDQIIVMWRHRVAKTALNREAELVALAEAEADAGFPGQKESELAVVRALLRLILSPNVRMPLSRLQ